MQRKCILLLPLQNTQHQAYCIMIVSCSLRSTLILAPPFLKFHLETLVGQKQKDTALHSWWEGILKCWSLMPTWFTKWLHCVSIQFKTFFIKGLGSGCKFIRFQGTRRSDTDEDSYFLICSNKQNRWQLAETCCNDIIPVFVCLFDMYRDYFIVFAEE